MNKGAAGNLLRWVECFLMVAETGHIGRAAQMLGTAQPPLSQTIKKLEAAVGANLFVRHPRGVSLSAEGRVFLPRAQNLVAAQQQIISFGEDLTQVNQTIQVLLPRTLPASWVAAVLLKPALGLPPVHWAGHFSAGIVSTVRDDPSVVGIVIAPIVTDELKVLPVVAVPQALTPGAPQRPKLDKAQLRRAVGPALLVAPRSDGPAAYDLLLAELDSAGVNTQIRQAHDSLRVAAELGAGQAAALVPIGTPGIKVTALDHTLLPLRLRVVHHPDASAAARATAIILQERLVSSSQENN